MICFNLLRRLAFAGLAITAAPLFAADVTSIWAAAANGTWTVDANWINVPPLGGYPNNGNGGVATYDAIINAVGPAYTVTLQAPPPFIRIENLTLSSANATVNHIAGTFTANGAITISAGSYQLNGGTISNTVINESGTGSLFIAANSANLLSGVTVNGDLLLNVNSAQTKITGGTTFTTAHVAGSGSSLGFAPGQTLTGTILFEGAAGGLRGIEMNSSSGSFTIGPTGVIRTETGLGADVGIGVGVIYGGFMTLSNQGLLAARPARVH